MRTLLRCGLLATVVVLAVSSHAATRTWIAGSGVWSNPANWQGGAAPVAGDDLVFPNQLAQYNATNDYPAGTAFQSLTFTHTVNGGTVVLDGNAIVLGAGGVTSNTSVSLRLPITLGADQTWSLAGPPGVTVTQTTNLNGQDLTLSGDGSIEWNGAGFAGTGSITTGVRLLVLRSPSTATAPLTVNGIHEDELDLARRGLTSIEASYPGPITMNTGPLMLGNCGTSYGTVTINGGSFTPRCAQTGTFAMAPAGVFREQMSSFDRVLTVAGTVTLGNAELELFEDGLFSPDLGEVFTVITNDGADPVVGTFAGLPEGAAVRMPHEQEYYRISYQGGTGNDVTLTAIEQQSSTFLVTNLHDSGPGSLRQALLDANATAGFDTVIFLEGLSGTITLTSGQIPVTEDVNVTGPAARGITVSGNLASRIFDIDADVIRISNLAFTNGRAAEGGAIDARIQVIELLNVSMTNNAALAGDGGALRVRFGDGRRSDFPELTFRVGNSTFSGNTAQNGDGGAIFAKTTDAVMDNVTMTGNQAGDSGGALYIEVDPGFLFSELRLVNSLVSGNESCRRAQTFTCGGGGIFARGANFVQSHAGVRIIASTIENNTAMIANGGLGGGVLCAHASGFGPCTITHSTLNANHAAQGGGAYAFDSRMFLVESTVVNNTAAGNGGGVTGKFDLGFEGATIAANVAGGNGGGVYFEEFSQHNFGRVEDTILADNAPNDLGTAAGVTVPVTYSLVENPGTASITPGPGYLTGVDPQLGPLQTDPGSPTATRDPAPASPVINAGDPAVTGGTDQRYYPRVAGGRVDMGAVEVQPPPPVSADLHVTTSATGPFIASQPVEYTITVANDGPSPASPTLTETLPAGSQFLGVSSTHGTCTGTTILTCTLGTLIPGETAQVTVDLIFNAPGTYTSTSSVTAPEPDPGPANNTATTNFTVEANDAPPFDLSLSKTATLANHLFFTITVANAGPGPAPDVVVTDPLPPGTTFVSATPSQGTCTLIGTQLTCTLGDLAAGASATISLALIPPESGSVTNTATVSAFGGGGDANAGNNTATATIDLDAEAADIPTWSTWAQMLAALGLALAGWVAVRR